MTDRDNNEEHTGILVRIDVDLEDMIPGYLANRRQDVRVIDAALEASDYETIRICGHSMKGSGGGYGFDTITELGEEIELGAKTCDPVRIRGSVDKLTYYLDHVVIQYEEIS